MHVRQARSEGRNFHGIRRRDDETATDIRDPRLPDSITQARIVLMLRAIELSLYGDEIDVLTVQQGLSI